MKRLSAEEVYPKSQLGKCAIYFNMSHHYRRIYSAKPRVDTNLKKSSSSLCCTSPDIFNFVRRNCMKQPIISTPRHKTCTKEGEEAKTFKPKILDSRAESKLKKLPVYEPPQRITIPSTINNETSTTKPHAKFKDDKEEEQKPEDKIATTDDIEEFNDREDSQVNRDKKIDEYEKKSSQNQQEERIRPIDKSTVMFLKDITDDILQKGIYTNKSLEKLFHHHMSKNKYALPKELMEEEVTRLKKELDMPIEEEKCSSESTVEDEEVLTALDSLLLPANIRDQVATSLGLKRKPPSLPSPKDSFTGSLVLTSMSETIDKWDEKSLKSTGTFILKKELNSQSSPVDRANLVPQREELIDERNLENVETQQSDDDKTIKDDDYPEEVSSEPKSNISEKLQKVENSITTIKQENKINSSSEERDPNQKSEIFEEKSSKDEKDNESEEESSDLSSIYTESD